MKNPNAKSPDKHRAKPRSQENKSGKYGPRTPEISSLMMEMGLDGDDQQPGEFIQSKREMNPRNFYNDPSIVGGTLTSHQSWWSGLSTPVIQREPEEATQETESPDAKAEEVAETTEQQATAGDAEGTETPGAETPADAPMPESDADVSSGSGGESEAETGSANAADFVAQLKAGVCAAVDAELAGTPFTSEACPYIAKAAKRLSDKSMDEVTALLQRYSSTSASTPEAMLDAVRAYAAQVTRDWVSSGSFAALPAEVAAELPEEMRSYAPGSESEGRFWAKAKSAASKVVGLFFKARKGGAKRKHSVPTVQNRLGHGTPIQSGTRGRMESAFGADFSAVRLHHDQEAVQLTEDMNAHALTVGEDIAFNQSEFQPGNPVGDAMLAHELAHVVQQRQGTVAGSEADEPAVEADADRTATGVVSRLWSGENGHVTGPTQRSGVEMRRCGKEERKTEKEAPEEKAEAEEERPPEPREVFRDHYTELVEDEQLSAADLQALIAKQKALGMDRNALESVFSFDIALDSSHAFGLTEFVLSENATVRAAAASYAATPEGWLLQPSPFAHLLKETIGDNQLTQDECLLLAKWWNLYNEADTVAAYEELGMDADLQRYLDTIFARPDAEIQGMGERGFFPFNLETVDEKLKASGDPNRIEMEIMLADLKITNDEFQTVRDMVDGKSKGDATTFFESLGIENSAATLLAEEFTRTEESFEKYMLGYKHRWYGFVLNDDGHYEFDEVTKFNIGLDFTTDRTSKAEQLDWAKNPDEQYHLEDRDVDGDGVPDVNFAFESGVTEKAEFSKLVFAGLSISMVIADSLLFEGTHDRIEKALGTVPKKHAKLIKEIRLDPGNHKSYNADAAHTGVINIYYDGAKADRPQNEIEGTFIHEVGHLVSFEALAADETLKRKWLKAMEDDKYWVSEYGTKNYLEDFAEMYIKTRKLGVDSAELKKYYPNRLALITPLM